MGGRNTVTGAVVASGHDAYQFPPAPIPRAKDQ